MLNKSLQKLEPHKKNWRRIFQSKNIKSEEKRDKIYTFFQSALTPFNLALKVMSYNPSHNLADNPGLCKGTLV